MARPHDPKNPRLELLADHAEMDKVLDRLLVHVRADETIDALRVWGTLEPAILAHLDAEEMYLLPALEQDDRVECDRLYAEHARIRRELGEIGMALELHTARREPIEALCAFLKEHAEHEEGILYPYAERRLPVAAVKSLVARLRGLAHRPKAGGARRRAAVKEVAR